MMDIFKLVDWSKKNNLFPNPPVVQSPHSSEVLLNGKKVLLFATNNYLGLMHDDRVVAAAVEGARKWGIGNGSARLLTGNLDIHKKLEGKIAKFKNRESALTFVSGYMVNSGSIPALVNYIKPGLTSLVTGISRDKSTIIFSDEYNHASIIAGIKMSEAKKEIYRHLDIGDLQKRIRRYSKKTRKMIITDGVFSMDGDIAPLPEILEIAKENNAVVYLDDAHATGILGNNGRGLEDYFDVEGKVDVVMGTFTKAFGGVGGFIVGSQRLIDYLTISSSTFIFTAPIAPPVVYGLIESIEIARKEDWRRKKVISNAKYLRNRLIERGFDIGKSQTQIIPIIIGGEAKAVKASKLLLGAGIFVPAAIWPAVSKGSARLRVTVSAEHEINQIDYLFEQLTRIKEELKF